MKSLYLVNGRLIGQGDVPTPESHAFFCSACGDIWGRVVVARDLCYCHQRPCEKHQWQFPAEGTRFPGSFLNPWTNARDTAVFDWALTLDYMPPEVIRREYQIHLTHFLREQGELATKETSDAVSSV